MFCGSCVKSIEGEVEAQGLMGNPPPPLFWNPQMLKEWRKRRMYARTQMRYVSGHSYPDIPRFDPLLEFMDLPLWGNPHILSPLFQLGYDTKITKPNLKETSVGPTLLEVKINHRLCQRLRVGLFVWCEMFVPTPWIRYIYCLFMNAI